MRATNINPRPGVGAAYLFCVLQISRPVAAAALLHTREKPGGVGGGGEQGTQQWICQAKLEPTWPGCGSRGSMHR